jgi:hypothetical protein
MKRTSTALGFLFFIFDLEYLIRVQSSEPLHARMNPTSCLFRSLFACAQTQSFLSNRAPKMWERHQLFCGLQLMSKEFQHLAIQTKIEHHFGRIFSSNKSAPANRKTGFYANHACSEQAGGWIQFCMK